MAFSALVVDQVALGVLDAALIELDWYREFGLPNNSEGVKRVVVGETIYILSSDTSVVSSLLVVNVGPSGVFKDQKRPQTRFERIIRVARRKFDRSISIPVQWQVYHEGSRLSVYGSSMGRRDHSRIYFEQNASDGNLYAYSVTNGPKPLLEVDPDADVYFAAISGLSEAISKVNSQTDASVGSYGILLNEPLGVQLSNPGTLQDWFERRLNKEQLEFVNKPLGAPVRLRGVAGTGKTQAMLVKCLRDLYHDADVDGDKKSFAFLTHSSALAHDVVRGVLYSLDPSCRWSSLTTSSGAPKLMIVTLYELAQAQLNYSQKGLTPISVDGREGRAYQKLLVDDALGKTCSDARIQHGLLKKDIEFAERLQSQSGRESLLDEILNEFACVLDAENIRKGSKQATSYLDSDRGSWTTAFTTRLQREIVLEIHGQYRLLLKKEGLMSMDQMIADFGQYLSTHEWERLRDRDGFDVIFVDEYHYFNHVEAMVLQSLFNPRSENFGRWPLFMAYDLKQSVSDAAIAPGIEKFRNPGIGKSVAVDLRENHRSTRQITRFLCDLDGYFPSLDLEGEYAAYNAVSKQAEGEVPTLLEYQTDISLVDDVFEQAVKASRVSGGRRVAVLCLNEALFDDYRQASRIEGKFVSVSSREDLRELRWARARPVFSMPDYVAGLQFETVYILNVDQLDLADEFISQGARRRYVSRLYSGAGRAQTSLFLTTSVARGGVSEVLHGPLQNRSLQRAAR